MAELSDTILVNRIKERDEQAFITLVKRYEELLLRSIRYQVSDAEAVGDIMQETLLRAWVGLASVREPRHVGAWLLQVARHRCQDFHRSPQQRQRPVEVKELEHLVNRYGQGSTVARSAMDEVNEALEHLPPAEREALQLFYIEGFSTAEIAARLQCPDGTVRRRLFHARNRVRHTLGITQTGRSYGMNTQNPKTKAIPFPQHRPNIVIKELEKKPFDVDSREVRWHFIVPEVGEQVRWAQYEGPEWDLWTTTHSQVRRPARIHGATGVEIEVRDSQRKKGRITHMYARLTEEMVEVLAVVHLNKGERHLLTFLDLDDWDWRNGPRRLADHGHVKVCSKGVFEHIGPPEDEVAAGLCSVQVGEQEFTCLRVFGVGEEISESGVLVEAYIMPDGRTLLWRRYNGRHWAQGGWEEALPDADRVVFNDRTFVHWYDNLSALACGLEG